MKTLYFAYGSNMNEGELKERGIMVLDRRKALLRHYKIALSRCSKCRHGGVLDIVSTEGDVVEGVLYELPDEARSKVEKKEGVMSGAYKERLVSVEIDGRTVENIVTYEVCNKVNPPPASDEYKKSVLKGAKNHNLSQEYMKQLEMVLSGR